MYISDILETLFKRRNKLGALYILLCSLLLTTSCAESDNNSDKKTLFSQAPEGMSFYEPPDPLPGNNGDVLWVEEIESAENGRVWKMLYRSESLRGEPIAVSGWIAIPDTPKPDDGYPILAFAHGTTGVADDCAPTIISTPHETIALFEDFLERGFVVAATDYEGLGTPGLHPYIIGPSEAHSVLDSARAARRFAGGGSDVILFGHSQGGHAVIFSNELASSYASDLNILGTIGSGSGVAQTDGGILEYLKTSPYKGFIIMTGAAQTAAYGEEEAPLSRWFTTYGIEVAEALEEICVDQFTDEFGSLDGNEIFVEGAPLPLTTDLYDSEQDSTPGLQVGASPLLMIHGRNDTMIPSSFLLPWVEDTCAIGQTIYLEWFDTGHRVPYEAPELAAPVIFDWIEDRFADLPAPSNCDAIPAP